MTKRTRALDITPHVKKLVWERDGGKCILCGSQFTAMPNAHYISRAHSGLGVEQNIVTLCMDCHHAYDNTAKRTAFEVVAGGVHFAGGKDDGATHGTPQTGAQHAQEPLRTNPAAADVQQEEFAVIDDSGDLLF